MRTGGPADLRSMPAPASQSGRSLMGVSVDLLRLGSFCVGQRSQLEPDLSMGPCAVPEAASQRVPPVSSCPLILMAGHLERREICLPALFLACGCQYRGRSPQWWGTRLCFRAPQHRPASGRARALPGVAAAALWGGSFVAPQRKHQGN